MSKKNEKDILDFLLSPSSDRKCIVCCDTFKGYRVFCEKEECKKAGFAYLESRRGSYLRDNYGLIDYQAPVSKTFLVDFPIKDDEDK